MSDSSSADYPQKIRKHFNNVFGQTPMLIRSPGRVNLIGEHTDYNMGYVLPASIDKAIYLAIQKRDDQKIHLLSVDYNDSYEGSLQNLVPSGKLWPDYILGVVEQMLKSGVKLSGFNIAFGGDIPIGAGLSSSAALECATGFALNELFNCGISKLEIVKMGQAAENQFVGVNCGIMDQFASVFGQEKKLIRLDCQSLEHRYIPFDDTDINIVLFNSQVKHSLASSAYNDRRAQCEKGVAIIQKHHPEVKSLRDATEQMLLDYIKPLDAETYKRCYYVVTEIKRLLDGCDDMENNDLKSFGKRMFETHAGLRDLYEVSCAELDHLVDLVSGNPDVLGSRMMGGGFGGCTINLIKKDAVDKIVREVTAGYKKLTGKDVQTYIAKIGNGTSVMKE